MKPTFHFSRQAAIEQLKKSQYPFVQILQRGSLEVEIYKPADIDKQQPHAKDELYVIISGSSSFFHEGNTYKVEAGDSLFVPAYDEHRFFNFTEDFVTWVFFFGPKGGEKV